MTNPSAADKMKLSRSRAVYRGQITKLQNKFGEIISQAVLTEDDHDTLVATIESLSEKLNIIVDMDKNILELSADDELEVVLTESDDYVTSIKQQIVKYRRQTERKFTPVVSTDIPTQTVNSTTDTHKRSVSLPKLMLKTFDGDILKWPEFNDSFVSAIDSNTTLSNVDKFQYLQGQLHGEAAESLHGLSLTNDNYLSAMSILRERYGQPHKVIDALFSNLWNLPCPDHTLVSLRDFYNQLETCIRGLSSMEDTKVSLANLNGPILLKTAIANISSDSNSTTVNILFDEGAQRSFITQSAADILNLKCQHTEHVQLSTFGEKTGTRSLPIANITLHTTGKFENLDINALVVPSISTPMRNYISKSVINLPHLQNLTLAHPYSKCEHEVISILIGADYFWSLVGNHVVRGPGPTAVSSKLGYLLSGPTQSKSNPNKSARVYHVNVNLESHRIEDMDLQRFWDRETIGIRDDEIEAPHDYTSYSQTHIRKEDDRYVAKLPWKENHEPLPANHHVAVKRTRQMARRLSEDRREAYNNIIQDHVSKGYVEPVQMDDITDGHYLPHRAVIKESSSTPLRIVYDCSCSQGNNPSLNDCLQTGPSLINDLTAILLRFRAHPVALSADIRKAFLQIGLDSDDRKYTKFLWLSNWHDAESDLNAYQFKSILFGAVCSPFILNATIRHHLEEHNSAITRDIAHNIYVDNVITGCVDTQQAVQYYNQANDVMTTGGFQLHSWSTNDPELRHYIDHDGTLNPNSQVNVLGIQWDTQTDKLTYQNNVNITSDLETLTKRMVVQQLAKLYDPLGYLVPVLMRAKLYIQELWRSKYEWDQPLPDDLIQQWCDISNDLSSATMTIYGREYFPHKLASNATFELHAFSDASQVAYGSVVYLRDTTHKQTALIMAKSRVSPVKKLTVPRLELLGVLIASRLLRYVFDSLSDQFDIVKLVPWTDSQIVLHWINSEKMLPVFVSNRLKAIRSNAIDEYKYCPSMDNPADIISRGVTFSDFNQSPIWWNGPEWLKYGDWPICHLFDSAVFNVEINSEPIQSETERSDSDHISHIATTSFMDPEQFATLSKLYRVTSYVLRFIHNTRNVNSPRTSFLTKTEIEQAEKLWLQRVQNAHYEREMEILRDNETTNRTSLIKQMRLFLDDNGLMRVGGRLHNAPLQYGAKFPILLPANDHLSKLLISDAHRRAQHAGVESTITLLRQNYWITRIRRAVKTVLRDCVRCKMVTGLPYQLPIPAPLQACRLQNSPPFTVSGLDYTGALYVKSNMGDRREDKVYILLFTCASTRAIHLETVSNLSLKSFLLAFRRFAARRSLPRKLISDNATTFLAANDEFTKLFNSAQVREFMLDHRIEWMTITKRAPWQGGFWERLIGLTKTTLKKVLGRALVTLDELTTIVTEAEMNINNRPLTYLSSSVDDLNPLTPSHLLHGRILTQLPHVNLSNEDINDPTFGNSRPELEKRAMYLAHLQKQFWERWVKEYVTSLRERHLLSRKSSRNSSTQIKVGDIVLIHDDNRNRIYWKIARVIKLIHGGDHLVRSAEIKTNNGVTNRPINKLYPLEVSSDDSPTLVRPPANQDDNDVATERTTRQAACAAKDRIKILAESGYC